jgi:hypothetical protein
MTTHYDEGYYPEKQDKGQIDLRMFAFDRVLDGKVNADIELIEATHRPEAYGVSEVSFYAAKDFGCPEERIGAILVRFSNGSRQCVYFDEINMYKQFFNTNGEPVEDTEEVHDFQAGQMLKQLGDWTQTSIHAPWDEPALDDNSHIGD